MLLILEVWKLVFMVETNFFGCSLAWYRGGVGGRVVFFLPVVFSYFVEIDRFLFFLFAKCAVHCARLSGTGNVASAFLQISL